VRWEVYYECLVDKNLEGCHDFFQGTILTFTWRDWGKSCTFQ